MRTRGLSLFFLIFGLFPFSSEACQNLFDSNELSESSKGKEVPPWSVNRDHLGLEIPVLKAEENALPHWGFRFGIETGKTGFVLKLVQPTTPLDKFEWTYYLKATYQSELDVRYRAVTDNILKGVGELRRSRWETTFDYEIGDSTASRGKLAWVADHFRVRIIHELKVEESVSERLRVEIWDRSKLQEEAPSFSFSLKNPRQIDDAIELFQITQENAMTPDPRLLVTLKSAEINRLQGEFVGRKNPEWIKFLEQLHEALPGVSSVLYHR